MTSSKTFIKGALFASAAAISAILPMQSAKATNGMFTHCVGTDRCGMGGAGVAMPSMATDTAVNPAASAFLGSEYTVNIGWFWADVEGRADINDYAIDSGVQTSEADNFPNGSMAVNYRLNDKTSLNVALYPGAGGATDWATSRTSGGFGGTGDATDDQEMDYKSVHLMPSISYKPSNDAAYGIGLILARGEVTTDSVHGSSGNRSANRDQKETFNGIGLHLGGIWKMDEKTNVAASYRSRVSFQKAGGYQGNVFSTAIDTPQQVQLGMAHQWNEKLKLAFDMKVIDYGSVGTIGNTPPNGFGWTAQGIFMIGAEYAVNDALTLRAGYNYGDSPVNEDDVFNNFLYPAIVEHHITVGASYDLGNGMTLGGSAYYAPEKTLRDSTNVGAAQGGNRTATYLSHEQKGFQVSIKSAF